MFIHFGMSTFTGDELDKGKEDSTIYAPNNPDPDQWIAVAKSYPANRVCLSCQRNGMAAIEG